MELPKSVVTGLEEALGGLEGRGSTGRIFTVRARTGADLKRLRSERLGMTQQEFAMQFGIALDTLRKWERSAREPDGPARAYLAVIEHNPEAVLEALRTERGERVIERKTR